MPRYEYKCRSCEEHFEVVKKMVDSSREESCPFCGQAYAKRVYYSTPVTYHCDGFYSTDYDRSNNYAGTKQDLLRKQYEAVAGEPAPPPAVVPRNGGEKY